MRVVLFGRITIEVDDSIGNARHDWYPRTMPKLSTIHPPAFWQALLLRTLRMVVRIALSSGHTSASTLLNLLRIAMYQELLDRGLSQQEMAVMLEASLSTIKSFARAHAELHTQTLEGSPLRRVIEALRAQPLTAAEIAQKVRLTYEFDMEQVVVSVLLSRGLIERLDGDPPRYGLNQPDVSERWEKPLSEVERLFEHSLAVVYCLLDKPRTLLKLHACPSLHALSQQDLQAVLNFLMQAGHLEVQTRGAHHTPVYAIRHGVLKLIPKDPEEQFRLGHLDMLDNLSRYFEEVLARPTPGSIGQRSFSLQIRPEDLDAFIPAHASWVRERLSKLQLTQQPPEKGMRAVVTWAIVQLTRSGA